MEQAKPNKLSASVKLTRAAWRVLKLDKELLLVSLMSVLTSFIVFGILIAILFSTGLFIQPTSDDGVVANFDTKYYAITAAYLFISYIIVNFFSGAISYGALQRFQGKDPTLKVSLGAAFVKFGPLTAFSGLQATVGLVLNIISDRLPFAGKIATFIAGAAWDVATMFTVPLIMDGKETRPLKAVRASAQTFLKIWGESAFIGIGLGFIEISFTIIMAILLVATIGLAAALSSWVIGLIGGAIVLLGVIAFIIIMLTLRIIVMTAAYYYASSNQIPAGFDNELVRSMFRPKKSWLK